MILVTIEEAQENLPELIRRQAPGEELQITSNGATVAKLVTVPASIAEKARRVLGAQRGSVLSMEHFDDPIEGLSEFV